MSHINESCHTQGIHHMWWLRLVSPLKLQVSFAQEPYTGDFILQKRRIILRSLLIVATPYASHQSCVEVSFAEYSLFNRALLQKRPVIYNDHLRCHERDGRELKTLDFDCHKKTTEIHVWGGVATISRLL